MFEKEENLCAQQKNNRALCALDKSANRLPRKAGHCSIPTTNRTKTIKQPHKTATQQRLTLGMINYFFQENRWKIVLVNDNQIKTEDLVSQIH